MIIEGLEVWKQPLLIIIKDLKVWRQYFLLIIADLEVWRHSSLMIIMDLEVWKSKLNIRGEQEHPLKKNKFQLLLCFFGTPSFTSSSVYFDVVQWSLWWRQCVIALAGEPSPQWEAGVVSQ